MREDEHQKRREQTTNTHLLCRSKDVSRQTDLSLHFFLAVSKVVVLKMRGEMK